MPIVKLGLGDDGHTASLFPGDSTVNAAERWVLPVAATKTRLARGTLTPQLINPARQVVFLVSGSAKADILRRVIEAPANDADLPALRIQPSESEALWLVDRDAAAGLSGR